MSNVSISPEAFEALEALLSAWDSKVEIGRYSPREDVLVQDAYDNCVDDLRNVLNTYTN